MGVDERWAQVLDGLRDHHGTPSRQPLPLGNHEDPYDEAVYISLTYMTRSQPCIEGAFNELRRLAGSHWRGLLPVRRAEVEEAIRPLGLIQRRTDNLLGLVEVVERDHGGTLNGLAHLDDVSLLKTLEGLPGLGQKGARCVAMYSFGRDVLPVDVHVLRVAKRLGFLDRDLRWSRANEELERQVPPVLRFDAHVLLVQHGRSLCQNKRPDCRACPLETTCEEAHVAASDRASYVPELRRRPSLPTHPNQRN